MDSARRFAPASARNREPIFEVLARFVREGDHEVLGSSARGDGILYLYGPYRRGGIHIAPSNAAFDESLRSRNRAWGVRDFDAVVQEAAARGFTLEAAVPMPASNLSVVLRHGKHGDDPGLRRPLP